MEKMFCQRDTGTTEVQRKPAVFYTLTKNLCATGRKQRKIGNVSERASSESGKDSRGTAAL
jgi:hypothetical protein